MIEERFKEFQYLDNAEYEEILRDPERRSLLMEYFFSKTESLSREYFSIEEDYKEQVEKLNSQRYDLIRIENAIRSLYKTPRLPSEQAERDRNRINTGI